MLLLVLSPVRRPTSASADHHQFDVGGEGSFDLVDRRPVLDADFGEGQDQARLRWNVLAASGGCADHGDEISRAERAVDATADEGGNATAKFQVDPTNASKPLLLGASFTPSSDRYVVVEYDAFIL